MEAKVGDRISIDARTVGQPRRMGTVTDASEGLSGLRYTVRWDDGTTSTFAPSAGNLKVEGRGRGGGKKTASANNARAGKATTTKKASAKKASGTGKASGRPKKPAKAKPSGTAKSSAKPKKSATKKSSKKKGKR